MMLDTLQIAETLQQAGATQKLAKAHAAVLQQAVNEKLVSKEDLGMAITELRSEIRGSHTKTMHEIANVRTELTAEIASVRTELSGEMKAMEQRILVKMYTALFALFGAIAAFMKLFG